MTDREFDEILRNSVEKYGNSYFDDDFSKHRFSNKFEKKMNALIKRRKSNIRIISIISSAAAVIVICATAGIIAMNNFRNVPTENMDITAPVSSSAAKSSTTESSAPDSAQNKNSTSLSQDNNKSIFPETKSNDIENAAGKYSDSFEDDNIANEDIIQNEAAPELNTSSSSVYSTTVLHKGENITISPETSGKIAGLISNLISDGSIVTDEQASIISTDLADYVISVNSNSTKPVCYDEDGNGIFSLTLYLSGNKGNVIFYNTNKVYSFTADNARSCLSELESLIP